MELVFKYLYLQTPPPESWWDQKVKIQPFQNMVVLQSLSNEMESQIQQCGSKYFANRSPASGGMG